MAHGNRSLVLTIAAAQGTGDRYIAVTRLADHHAIPLLESGVAHRQPAQPVIGMRVHAGLIEQHVGGKIRNHIVERVFKNVEILLVRGSVFQRNIEAGPRLACGKIPGAVDQTG